MTPQELANEALREFADSQDGIIERKIHDVAVLFDDLSQSRRGSEFLRQLIQKKRPDIMAAE